MTLAIELPEELEKELLQQVNVNEFVQEAIKRLLLEQKQATHQNSIQHNFVMEEDNTEELLELITHITPVKCQYTTEQIVRSLRDGTELE